MTQALALLSGAGRLGWRERRQVRRLTTDRARRRLADGLVRAVADADGPTQSISAAIPVQRRAVIGCRDELLELAERLRARGPVYVQGIAMASALLSDAASPLYQSGGDLAGAVATALAALDGHLG